MAGAIVCAALLITAIAPAVKDALTLRPSAESWSEARRWDEGDCWLLLRHVPLEGETGVWAPGPEQAVQTMQKAMRLSYLCAPRRIVPLSEQVERWPKFVLVGQSDEENFLEHLSKLQHKGAQGSWYPVETIQMESGESTLYAEASTDDGNPELAAQASEKVSADLEKIMRPPLRLRDGVCPAALILLSLCIGYCVWQRFAYGLVDEFTSMQRISLQFNLGMNLLGVVAACGMLAGLRLEWPLIGLALLCAVLQMIKKQRPAPDLLKSSERHMGRAFQVIWWLSAIILFCCVFADSMKKPLSDPPGMGVWCWRAKAMLADGKYPFAALASGASAAIHQPDYPPLFSSLLMILSWHGGDAALDVWSKLLPFLGWFGMLAFFSGFSSATWLQKLAKLSALLFLASPTVRQCASVVTADAWLWFTMLCAVSLILANEDGSRTPHCMLTALFLAAMSWCKREGMLVSVLLALACVAWGIYHNRRKLSLPRCCGLGIMLLLPITATAVWMGFCWWCGLSSSDLRFDFFVLWSQQNWPVIKQGWWDSARKVLFAEPGAWLASVALAVAAGCVCSRRRLPSLSGVLMIIAMVCAALAPLLFVFSTFPVSMLDWQITTTLPRLWVIPQLLMVSVVAATCRQSGS